MSAHSGFFKGDNHLEVIAVIANCGTDIKRARDALIVYIKAKQRKGKSVTDIEDKLSVIERSFANDPWLHAAFHRARSKTGMPPSQLLPAPPPGILERGSVDSRPSSDYRHVSMPHPAPGPVTMSISAPTSTYWRFASSGPSPAGGPTQPPHIPTDADIPVPSVDPSTSAETSRRRGTCSWPNWPPSYMANALPYGSSHYPPSHDHDHDRYENHLNLGRVIGHHHVNDPRGEETPPPPYDPFGERFSEPVRQQSIRRSSDSHGWGYDHDLGFSLYPSRNDGGFQVSQTIGEDLEVAMRSLALSGLVQREIIKCVFSVRGYERERWATILGDCGLDPDSVVYMLMEMERDVAYRGGGL